MKIVTICGSMKFAKEMHKIAGEIETKNGYCVIQCVYDIDENATQEEMTNVCLFLLLEMLNLDC